MDNSMVVGSTTVAFSIFGILISVISYFLRGVYTEFKELKSEHHEHKEKTSESLGRLKGQIELTNQKHDLRYQQIEEKTQLEIKNLAENVNRLSVTIERLITHKEKEL
jgi:predicted PurR-regulated permease PerM